MRRVLLVIALLAVLSGCTTATGGAPAPGPGPAQSTGITLPPRPREMRVDGVDPCSLLTAEQRAEFGLDGSPIYADLSSALYEAKVPSCSISGFQPRAISAGLGVVTTKGIELFTGGRLLAELSPTTAAGFPALVARPTRATEYCTVLIDVAAGQLVEIQFADGGRPPPIPQDQLCLDAQHMADAVMATLLAR